MFSTRLNFWGEEIHPGLSSYLFTYLFLVCMGREEQRFYQEYSKSVILWAGQFQEWSGWLLKKKKKKKK